VSSIAGGGTWRRMRSGVATSASRERCMALSRPRRYSLGAADASRRSEQRLTALVGTTCGATLQMHNALQRMRCAQRMLAGLILW
jgi:hypothetical protein